MEMIRHAAAAAGQQLINLRAGQAEPQGRRDEPQ